MDSWNFLQKVYYAEVNLLRHGKRIIDYDTRRDRKDRDKTEKNAPDTKKRSQEELRTLGRPQIEDSHTVSHQTVSDTSDDWFEHKVYY